MRVFLRYLLKTLLWIFIGVFFVLILFYNPQFQSYLLKKGIAYIEKQELVTIEYADFQWLFPFNIQIDSIKIVGPKSLIIVDKCTCCMNAFLNVRMNIQNMEYVDERTTLFVSELEINEIEIDLLKKQLMIDQVWLDYLRYREIDTLQAIQKMDFEWQVIVKQGVVVNSQIERNQDRWSNLTVQFTDLRMNQNEVVFGKTDLSCLEGIYYNQQIQNLNIKIDLLKIGNALFEIRMPQLNMTYNSVQMEWRGNGLKNGNRIDVDLQLASNVSRVNVNTTTNWQGENRIYIDGEIGAPDLKMFGMKESWRNGFEYLSFQSEIGYKSMEWVIDECRLWTDQWSLDALGSILMDQNGAVKSVEVKCGGIVRDLEKWQTTGTFLYRDSICRLEVTSTEKNGLLYADATYNMRTDQVNMRFEVDNFTLGNLIGQSWGELDMAGLFCGKIQNGVNGVAKIKIEELNYKRQNYGEIMIVDTIVGDEMRGFAIFDNSDYQCDMSFSLRPSALEFCGKLNLLNYDSLWLDYDIYGYQKFGRWEWQFSFPEISNRKGCLGDLCVIVDLNKVYMESGDLTAELVNRKSWSSFIKGNWTNFLHRKGSDDFMLKMQFGTENILSSYLKQYNIYGEKGRLDMVYQADLNARMVFENVNWNDIYLDSLLFVFDKDRFDVNGHCLSVVDSACMDVKLKGWLEGNQMYAYLSRFPLTIFSRIKPNMPDLQGYCSMESSMLFNQGLKELRVKAYVDSLKYQGDQLGDWQLLLQSDDQKNTEIWIDRDGELLLQIAALPKSEVYKMWFQKMPLSLLNVFLPRNSVLLSGEMEGELMVEDGVQEGNIQFQKAQLKILPIETTYKLDSSHVTITDDKLIFDNFKWIASDQSAIGMNGYLDRKLEMKMAFTAQNFQFLNSRRNSRASLLSGKAYADINAELSGSVWALRFRGRADVLGSSRVWYHTNAVSQSRTSDEMIRFVNSADTMRDMVRKSMLSESFGMQILAQIESGAEIGIDLSADAKNQITVNGNGDLLFSMENGQKSLNGKYNITEGVITYNMPIVGEKRFNIEGGSLMEWIGNMNNPMMNIVAKQVVMSSVTEENGGVRMVNFVVKMNVSGDLASPQVSFDLQIPNDVLLQSQLASYSPDERTRLALNLLVYGTYNVPTGQSPSYTSSNALSSFVENELNQWIRRYLGNVGLAFGVNTVNKVGAEGQSIKQTNYSYRYSRSLFDNRIHVKIGGSVTTDKNLSPTEDQSLIDDIGVEYLFSKRKNLLLKAFRQENYESAFDGDVTRTGVGIVWRKDYWHVMDVFRCKK